MKPGGKWALIGVGIGAVATVGVVIASAHALPSDVSCPAVGRVVTVDVRISGDAPMVHDVRLCTTGGCSAPPAGVAEKPSPSPSATPDSGVSAPATAPVGGELAAPIPAKPTGPELPAPVAPTGATTFAVPRLLEFAPKPLPTWTFDTLEQYPTKVSTTAYGADGRALGSRVVDLRWHLFAPGDVCDVTKVTGPVVLHVGS